MSERSQSLRIQLLIGFMCVALIVYFVLLGRIAMAFITSGEPAAIGLGVALLVMPVIGIWVMVSTVRAGLTHQRLGRIVKDEGMELDVGALKRSTTSPMATPWATSRAREAMKKAVEMEERT